MKSEIHPNYQLATVSCACGNVFQTHGGSRPRARAPRAPLSRLHDVVTAEQGLSARVVQISEFQNHQNIEISKIREISEFQNPQNG